MSVHLLFVHALSPLHAGTGQSVGAVELAIARDRATGLPYLPGTSVKGSLRDRAQATLEGAAVEHLFGPDTVNADKHAGAVVFGDANLLLLPVRSAAGTFAWMTSPYILSRFVRDLREAGLGGFEIPAPTINDAMVAAADSPLKVTINRVSKVVVEDLDLVLQNDARTATLAKKIAELVAPTEAQAQAMMLGRICVVHDDVMAFFSEHGTDVVARVQLNDDTKTVKNLWHEESLPTETVLVALVDATRNSRATDEVMRESLQKLCGTSLQMGGKATVGRGRCRLVFTQGRPDAGVAAARTPPPAQGGGNPGRVGNGGRR